MLSPMKFCKIPLREINNGVEYFCALGILCELHRREHPGNEWELIGDTDTYSYLDAMWLLPSQVKMWAGVSEDVGSGLLNGHQYNLVKLSRVDGDFTAIREFLKMALNSEKVVKNNYAST